MPSQCVLLQQHALLEAQGRCQCIRVLWSSLLPSLKYIAILPVSATPLHQVKTTVATWSCRIEISIMFTKMTCVTCQEGATCSTRAAMLNASREALACAGDSFG